MMKFDCFRSYFVVLGGFLIHLSLGYYYISGNIHSLIIEYMINNSYSKSIDQNDSTWLVGSTLLGLGAAVSFGGFIDMKIGSKLTVLFGGWFSSLNICLMYFTIKTYWFIVVITYGFFVGIGAGIAYGVAIGTPIKWFSVRKGLIFGIITSGFGLSSGIFVPIQSELIRKFDKNLPKVFPIIGAIFAVLQLIGSILLDSKESEENSSEYQYIVSTEEKLDHDEKSPNSKNEIAPHKLIFIPDFWILWLIFCLNSCSYTIFIIRFTTKFENITCTHSENQLYFVVICAISGFFGRIFWGYLVDKISYKKVMLIMNLMLSLFLGTFIPINKINSHLFIYICSLWVAVINFCYSGNISVLPAICANLFGMKYFICNYGMIFTGCSAGASIVGLILTLIQTTKNVGTNSFIIGSFFSLLASVVTLLYRGKTDIVRLT